MTQSLQGTGEEWKAMDHGARYHQPGAGAAVVAAAKANIPRIRMRDVELRLVDKAGKPLGNRPVEVVQTKGAFPFGDQLWGLDRMYRFGQGQMDQAKALKARHAEALNSATALCYWTERPENDGPKSEDVQGDPQMDHFARIVEWARGAGLTVKGHPLFWSIPKCVPEWVKRYPYETQMKFAEVRVRNLVARFKGQVALWDAVNEPMWESSFRNLPQRHWPHLESIDNIVEYIEPVLRWCREEDPEATFLVNDYGMEDDKQGGELKARDGTVVTAALQRQRFRALLKALGDRGVPPDAVGLQSHTGGWISHETQVAVYDEMATCGLPLHITEFWAHTGDLEKEGKLPLEEIYQMQAQYVGDYLTVAFGHPAMEGFFFWGFMNGVKWKGEHSGHSLTPMFTRVRDLVKKEWMTRLSARTNADGVVRFRGFFGDYSLRYSVSPGVSKGVPFQVGKEQAAPLTLAAALV